ncbi:hypothetical protein NHX12_033799 [Muraenolepis orangiensis]|uniref:Reverse transcriptase domain-containing protein n=1 Tax=Muraenolepis orangiensis TaxID=630683 RepID=A0A9Q0IJ48_9TELE|nr:hypothetical protein NHX12_033799 [Muraenolepis orangiensis]
MRRHATSFYKEPSEMRRHATSFYKEPSEMRRHATSFYKEPSEMRRHATSFYKEPSEMRRHATSFYKEPSEMRRHATSFYKEPSEMRRHATSFYKEPSEMRRHATSFYKELFIKEYVEGLELAGLFFAELPQVDADTNVMLDTDLSLEELHTALMSLGNGKAPGIDGLPVEFYKSFWPIVGEDLLEVFRDSLQKGQLPLSCRRAAITLLQKRGICKIC